MNAREMHYDFKQKLNKLDSNQNRNLKVPEIDWKLNEAQEVIVKIIAQPRFAKQLGFEINQRTIDDIRTIVINQTETTGLVPVVFDEVSYKVSLPDDYWFYAKGRAIAKKGSCTRKVTLREIQHDDDAEISAFDKSSFEWKKCGIRFINEGIRIFTDGTFTVEKVMLDYIKKPRLIHNAQDFIGGTYTTLSGAVLTGTQSCELPEGLHREIVDLAVAITAGDISLPDFSYKQQKLQLSN